MATFDPITYTAVTKLKDPVGALRLVPENFTSTDYVDSGKQFDPVAYPDLAPMGVTATDPTEVTEQTITSVTSSYSSSINVISDIAASTEYNGELYLFFRSGAVYKTVNGDISSIEYFRMLPDIISNYLNIGMVGSTSQDGFNYAGGILYVAPYNSSTGLTADRVVYAMTISDISDANNETVSTTNLSNQLTGLTDVSDLRFFSNGSTWLALYPAGMTNNKIFQSTDGVNFTARTPNTGSFALYSAAYSPGLGMWIAITSGSSGTTSNYATSTDGGETWTGRYNATFTSRTLPSVIWYEQAGKFVYGVGVPSTTANNTSKGYWYSSDGITWTATNVTSSISYLSGSPNFLVFDNTLVSYGASMSKIPYNLNKWQFSKSTDGISFTFVTDSTAPNYWGLGGAGCYSHMTIFNGQLVYFGTIGTDASMKHAVFSYCTSSDLFQTKSVWYTIKGKNNKSPLTSPVFVGNIGIMVENYCVPTATSVLSMTSSVSPSLQTSSLNGAITTDGGQTWSTMKVDLPAPIWIKNLQVGNSTFRLIGLYCYYTGADQTAYGTIVGDSSNGVDWVWYNDLNSLTSTYIIDDAHFSMDKATGSYYRSQDQAVRTMIEISIGTADAKFVFSSDTGIAGRATYNGAILLKSGNTIPLASVYSAVNKIRYSTNLPSTLSFGTNTTSSAIVSQFRIESSPSRVVMFISGSSYCFVSKDTGITWSCYSTPFTFSDQNYCAVSDEWIVVTSLVSNIVWKSRAGYGWSSSVINASGKGLLATTDGVKFYYSGPVAYSDNKIYASTGSQVKITPMVESTVNGAKWVVKGKN